MTATEITVVVPVWNGEHHIHLCLDALARQTLPRERFTVLVVDNGSTDATAAVVRRYPFVQLLVEPRPGSYCARNTALELVKTPFVAFTDADCVPANDWLESALAALAANPGAGVIAGHVALIDPSGHGNRTCIAYEQLFNLNQQRNAERGHSVTANWSARTSLMRQMGGFDQSLKSGGDFALSHRISVAGHPVVYAPGVVVSHPVRGRLSELMAKRRRTVGGQWTMLKGTRSAPRFALANIRLARQQLRVVHESTIPPLRKAGIDAVVALLLGAALAEHVRLLAGGEPRRS